MRPNVSNAAIRTAGASLPSAPTNGLMTSGLVIPPNALTAFNCFSSGPFFNDSIKGLMASAPIAAAWLNFPAAIICSARSVLLTGCQPNSFKLWVTRHCTPESMSRSRPTRWLTARESPSCPNASTAAVRAAGLGSRNICINGSTARLSSDLPSTRAAALRTSSLVSFNAKSSGSTDSVFSNSSSFSTTASRIFGLLTRSC